MFKTTFILTAASLLILETACKPEVDREHATQQILRILQDERNAHFQKDIDYFTTNLESHLVSVNKGIVSKPTPSENAIRWKAYFNSVKFIKWDDAAEPIIRIADDGSLAYAIVQKIVIVKTVDSLNYERMDTTHFAWTSIYRRKHQRWKLEAITSTNK